MPKQKININKDNLIIVKKDNSNLLEVESEELIINDFDTEEDSNTQKLSKSKKKSDKSDKSDKSESKTKTKTKTKSKSDSNILNG
jgi:hypothetical protein